MKVIPVKPTSTRSSPATIWQITLAMGLTLKSIAQHSGNLGSYSIWRTLAARSNAQ